MDDLTLLVPLGLACLAVGGLLGWLAGRSRAVARIARLEAMLDAGRDTEPRLQQALRALSFEAAEHGASAVAGLVGPLGDTLGKVERQMAVVERERAAAFAALETQVLTMHRTSEQLRAETAALVTALRAPQVRGRWGETQLRRVVEAAGMLEHCDFLEQPTSSTSDGTLRPDLVVTLAGGRQVVVDAKVPFAGYLEAMEARDDRTRDLRLDAHARHLRAHVDELGAKAYWERFEPSPEFVVLFVPADAFLDAALARDATLLEHAFTRDVVLATPSTLMALLRTIAYTWRQEALSRNAREVHALGRELHARIGTLGGHLSRVGSSLGNAVTAFNAAVGTLEGRVLVTARRLTDLQVTTADLASPPQVEVVARQLQAAELVGSGDPTRPDGAGAGSDEVLALRRRHSAP